MRARQKKRVRERGCDVGNRAWIADCRMKEGPQTEECRPPPDAEEGKGTDSPLELLEGTQSTNALILAQ